MENKVIVLKEDGNWLELKNCVLVGAAEFPDKVLYHKIIFSNCEKEIRDEMLVRAGQYLSELKNDAI